MLDFGSCLVYLERAPGKFFSVQPCDRREGMQLTGHLHETETSRCVGKHHPGHLNRLDVTEFPEQFGKLRFGHLGCEIANENIHVASWKFL